METAIYPAGNIKVTYRWTSRLSMRIAKNGDVNVSAPYGMPKSKIEKFINEHRDWIVRAREKTQDRQRKRSDFYGRLPLNTRQQAVEAAERLRLIVTPMIEQHALEMGVRPQAITFKPTISRWGLCNVKNRTICFSTYLLLLPSWCIEHVVVHELCHLLEPSHNSRFHSLMDRYFPRWKEARRETRKIVNGLKTQPV